MLTSRLQVWQTVEPDGDIETRARGQDNLQQNAFQHKYLGKESVRIFYDDGNLNS